MVLVAVGAALGGVARYVWMTAVARLCGERFPWGTLSVNAVGSFLLGVILGAGSGAAGAAEAVAPGWGALGAAGFCGGLTTFSTFSLQTLDLVTRRRWRSVVANAGGGVILCVLCAAAGYALCRGGGA